MQDSPESKSILPDTLKDVWDEELKALFGALSFKDQTFCLEYLEHGVGSKAYEKSHPGVVAPSSYVCASGLLRTPKVRAFITAYREKDINRAEDDRALIRSTFRDGMQANVVHQGIQTQHPDHDVRIKAGQALAKLDGLNVAEVVTINPSEEFRKLWDVAKGPK